MSRNITPDKKAAAIELAKTGVSAREIARTIGMALNTANRIVSQHRPIRISNILLGVIEEYLNEISAKMDNRDYEPVEIWVDLMNDELPDKIREWSNIQTLPIESRETLKAIHLFYVFINNLYKTKEAEYEFFTPKG